METPRNFWQTVITTTPKNYVNLTTMGIVLHIHVVGLMLFVINCDIIVTINLNHNKNKQILGFVYFSYSTSIFYSHENKYNCFSLSFKGNKSV